MAHRQKTFPVFIKFFAKYLWVVRHVMLSLVLLVVIGAVILSLVEDISLGNSVYLSFITAFTIGYGDITPATTIGRVLSVVIGLIGIIFTGLVVAVSTRALASTIEYQRKHK